MSPRPSPPPSAATRVPSLSPTPPPPLPHTPREKKKEKEKSRAPPFRAPPQPAESRRRGRSLTLGGSCDLRPLLGPAARHRKRPKRPRRRGGRRSATTRVGNRGTASGAWSRQSEGTAGRPRGPHGRERRGAEMPHGHTRMRTWPGGARAPPAAGRVRPCPRVGTRRLRRALPTCSRRLRGGDSHVPLPKPGLRRASKRARISPTEKKGRHPCSQSPASPAVVWGAQMECGNKRRRRVLRHVHQSAGLLLNVSAFLSRFVSMQ